MQVEKELRSNINEPLVIWGTIRWRVAEVAASLAFVAGAIYLCMSGGPISISIGVVVGLLFVAAGAHSLHRIISPVPALVIDQLGITDRHSSAGVGFVPWSDIVEIREQRVAGMNHLGLYVRNPEELLARRRWYKRLVMRVDILNGSAPVMIEAIGLPISLDRLRQEMQRFMPSPISPSGRSDDGQPQPSAAVELGGIGPGKATDSAEQQSRAKGKSNTSNGTTAVPCPKCGAAVEVSEPMPFWARLWVGILVVVVGSIFGLGPSPGLCKGACPGDEVNKCGSCGHEFR